MPTFKAYTYDVWGNADDGYDVNDAYPRGEVMIHRASEGDEPMLNAFIDLAELSAGTELAIEADPEHHYLFSDPADARPVGELQRIGLFIEAIPTEWQRAATHPFAVMRVTTANDHAVRMTFAFVHEADGTEAVYPIVFDRVSDTDDPVDDVFVRARLTWREYGAPDGKLIAQSIVDAFPPGFVLGVDVYGEPIKNLSADALNFLAVALDYHRESGEIETYPEVFIED